jgi:hypothetical protein
VTYAPFDGSVADRWSDVVLDVDPVRGIVRATLDGTSVELDSGIRAPDQPELFASATALRYGPNDGQLIVKFDDCVQRWE